MPFIATYFNELVSSSTITRTSCHSALRVYPELQNPLFPKATKPSPLREKVPEGRMRGKLGINPKTLYSPSTSSYTLLEYHDH